MPDLAFLRHIKKLVILAIFSDDSLMERLVLKGGNLLDVVYELSARASVDVDLSMEDEFEDVDDLRQRVLRALETTFSEHGYTVFDFSLKAVPPKMTDDIKDFWGGYQVAFKIIEQEKYQSFQNNLDNLRRNAANIGNRDSTIFKVDISRHEFCEEKQQFLLDDYSIYGYSPEMFVAEKLRAVCQQMPEYVEIVHLNPRGRARDFLDVQIVSEHYAINWSCPFRNLQCGLTHSLLTTLEHGRGSGLDGQGSRTAWLT